MGSVGERGYAPDAPASLEGEYIFTPHTTSGAVTDENGSKNSEAQKNFDLNLRVLLAERHNHDLEIEKAKMMIEDNTLRARIRELEANVDHNTSDGLFEELAACKQALAIAQEDVREAARKKTLLIDEVIRLRKTKEKLTDERDRLLLKLDEAKARSRGTQIRENLVDETQVNHVAALEARNELLISKNNELTAKHFTSIEAAQKSADEARFAQAKLRNVEYELQELREGISASQATRARSQSERLRVVHETNEQEVGQTVDISLLQVLMNEHAKLKEDKVEIERDALLTKDEMTHYITKLDIANAGFRAFDCTHDNDRDIPDHKSTTEFKPDRMARGLYVSLCEDEDFMACYCNWRQHYLKHHRLHEHAHDEGRAVASWRLKEFVRLDENRGVTITYR